MNIKSAEFIKGITNTDDIALDERPQIVFIGRSNVGKSSLINSLTGRPGLAKSSSMPGRTKQLNFFLINKDFYFIDVPGYGYAKASKAERAELHNLIEWYLFNSEVVFQKVVLIVDAKVGPTKLDIGMLEELREHDIPFVVLANKFDQVKKNLAIARLKEIKAEVGEDAVFPYCSLNATNKDQILQLLLSK